VPGRKSSGAFDFEEIPQMAILVTGGAGFIGSHLVERLAARGERVVVIDDFNDYYSVRLKRANAALVASAGDVSVREGDIRDAAFLSDAAAGEELSAVIHLAARAGVRPSLADPHLYVDVNLRGTLNLLELARRRGIPRFVFASSSSVYGASRDVPFREDAAADRPESPYGATKRAGELLVSTYARLYGISAASLRFFTVYGPRQRPDMAIHKFTRLITAGQRVPFFGGGDSARDYTYISDIIDGVTAAADGEFGYEVINLGDSSPVTLSCMVETISAAVGKPAALERLGDQPGDVPITFADISKAGRLLAYRPKVAFEEGVARFVEWYGRARQEGLVE
jgi:UDP-glucuronate 4-epimerase